MPVLPPPAFAIVAAMMFNIRVAINKACDNCKNNFTWEDEDLSFFEKFGVEPYDTCRKCLHMQRLSFRNERCFYRRKCDATGKDILSIHSPESPYTVYCSDYYWSDKWDPLNYGRDFDFDRPFFDQFSELLLEVPRLAIFNIKSENSEYCNTAVGNKDCYMLFGADFNENCMYGVLGEENKSCLDVDYSEKGELLYFCSDTAKCYGCHYLFNAKVCSNCYFCEDMSGCSECILCFDLKNKKYCIGNKQYSKEEYFEKKKQLIDGSSSGYKRLFEKFLSFCSKKPKRYANNINCQDCTGNYVVNSKNCTLCFDVVGSEDCRDIISGVDIKNCFMADMIHSGSELCFNNISTLRAYDVCFSVRVVESSNVRYSESCVNSRNIFGFVSLNHGEYCILNKKYEKEDYEKTVAKIIEHMERTGEWGQNFPPKLSYFGYNETTANLYWPLSKDEALRRGFNWRDEPRREYAEQTYEVPDNINDVKDDISDAVLKCSDCGRNFKILKEELGFYRSQKVPIPDECFDCRMKTRAGMRTPRELWDGSCFKCGAEFKTSYDPAEGHKLYCEKCYREEVY